MHVVHCGEEKLPHAVDRGSCICIYNFDHIAVDEPRIAQYKRSNVSKTLEIRYYDKNTE